MSEPQPEPGWYYAQGDPVGTQRYWDGGHWVGEPAYPQNAPGATSDAVRHQYGSAIERLGANIIDGLLVAIPVVVLFFVLGESIGTVSFALFGLLLGAAYSIGFVGLQGATPGKMAVGLEIVRAEDGETPPGFEVAAKRWVLALAGLVPIIGSLISLGIAIACGVLISNDAHNRSLYDRIANTYVVKK